MTRARIDPKPRAVDIRHLWSSNIAELTLTRAELRRVLLDTGGTIQRYGYLCDLKAKHLGAGVYRVIAEERKYA